MTPLPPLPFRSPRATRRRVRTAGFLLMAGLLAGRSPSAAAAEAPLFGELVEVQVVELELLVTDRQGRPVEDLRRDEVRVFEDGEAVEIRSFELAGAAGPASSGDRAAGSPATSGAEAALVAVLIDEVHVGAGSRRLLMHQLNEVLAGRLQPADRVMLAVYDGGVRVTLPFTADRRALAEALLAAEGFTTARLQVENERREAIDRVRWEADENACQYLDDIIRATSEQELHRVEAAIGALDQLVGSLSGLAGRKVLLHVSDGIPVRAGAEISDYAQEMCSGTGAEQGQPGAHSVFANDDQVDRYNPTYATLDPMRYDTTSLWQAVVARANAANVSIYPLQAGRNPGAVPGGATEMRPTTSLATQARSAGNEQESLFALADGTGGRALLGGGDLRAELATTLVDLHRYYRLAYTPPAAGPGEPALRRIRVEVTRPGLELRHRKVYRQRSVHEQVADQLLGRLLYGAGEGTTTARLEVGAMERNGERVRTRFRLQVPLGQLTLLARDTLRQGLLTVFVALVDERGGTSAVRQTAVPVRLPAQAAADAPRDFTWEVELSVRPGKQRLGVAVRDELSGETTYLLRDFEAPGGRRPARAR